jgi:hypothetical protein
MKPEEQKIAIAEACSFVQWSGLAGIRIPFWRHNGFLIPFDPLNDLNAMHEANKELPYFPDYLFHLRNIVGPFPDAVCEWTDHHWQYVVAATAAQHAEAFLKTIGKWEI